MLGVAARETARAPRHSIRTTVRTTIRRISARYAAVRSGRPGKTAQRMSIYSEWPGSVIKGRRSRPAPCL
jgi:hypothetical protein